MTTGAREWKNVFFCVCTLHSCLQMKFSETVWQVKRQIAERLLIEHHGTSIGTENCFPFGCTFWWLLSLPFEIDGFFFVGGFGGAFHVVIYELQDINGILFNVQAKNVPITRIVLIFQMMHFIVE